MKNRIKSLSKLFFITVFIAGLLTACVNSPSADPVPTDKEIKIKQSSSVAGGLDPETSLFSDKILKRFDEIKENSGYKISVSVAPASTILSNIQTSAPGNVRYADIIYTDTLSIYSLWKENFLISLQDIPGIDITSDKWGSDGFRTLMTLQDGKTYGFTNAFWADPLPSVAGVLYYNDRLIKSNQLGSPSEMLEHGQWTLEKFEQMCKDITHDGTYGFITPTAMYPEFVHSAIYANNGKRITVSESGKFVCGYEEESTLRALDWVNRLVTAEKVSYTPASVTENADTDAFARGITLFLAGNSETGLDTSENSLLNTLGEDLRWCEFPRSSSFNAPTTAYYSYGQNVMAVTKFADASSVGQILNALFEPLDGQTSDSWRETAARKNFFHNSDLQLYASMISAAGTDRSLVAADIQTQINQMLERVASGEKTPSEAVSQISALVTSSIE